MAIVDKNLFLKGVSGSVGKTFVLRMVGDVGIMAASPGKRTSPPTPDQIAHQERFKSAVKYAKKMMTNAADKAEYAIKKRKTFDNEYNLAVSDFMNPPTVVVMNTSGYKGRRGDLIYVQAEDDFAVKSVKIQVFAADGSLVEEGLATAQASNADWLYKATLDVADLAGAKVVASATDKPGNVGVMEKAL